jgi:hypothetical protein
MREGAQKPTIMLHQWLGVLEGRTMNTTKQMDSANGMRASSKNPIIMLVQWLWVLRMIITSILNVSK